ncbi:MAG: SDR family NAD(P)-dependent oxidoreductase [Bacteroidales bacterium]|nr:SDR family NAD(P)-dependent oxidoreductase [Bacteroidales bacterium]
MQNPYQLTDKIALITGGAEGIGLGTAKVFISLGAKVVITGRTLKTLQVAQKRLGSNCLIYQNDITDKSSNGDLLAYIEKEAGALDILVHNAGKHLKKPSLEVTDQEFQSVVDTNLNSVFALTRSALKGMIQRQRGSVIFISSMVALYGLEKVIAYTSSKTALLGMTRALASEYSHTGVRFNAIAPGFIESKMLAGAMDNDPERKSKVLMRTPAGRFGKPEEIGMAAAFLASDASKFITGVCLPVDGGNAIGF